MNRYVIGLISGFCATVVLSIFMLIKASAGMLPSFNVIAMLAGVTGGGPVSGWIAHFVIGTVLWGVIFAAINASIPGAGIVKGLIFGVAAWLAMMIIFMPVAGAGFFATSLGLPVVIATLVLHLIYGAVLGLVYASLAARGSTHTAQA